MLIRTNYRDDGSLVLRQAFNCQGLRYHMVIRRSGLQNTPIKADQNSQFSTVALGQIAQIGKDIFKKLGACINLPLVYTKENKCYLGPTITNDSDVIQKVASIFNHLSSPCKVGVSKTPGALVNRPTREKTTLKAPPPPESDPDGSVDQSSPCGSVASTPRSVVSQASSVESLNLPPIPIFKALDEIKLVLADDREITYTELANYSLKHTKYESDELWEVYARYVESLNDDTEDEEMCDWISDLIKRAEAFYEDLSVPNPKILAKRAVYNHIAINILD